MKETGEKAREKLTVENYVPRNLNKVAEDLRDPFVEHMKMRLEGNLALSDRELQIAQIKADMNVRMFVPQMMNVGGKYNEVWAYIMVEDARLVKQLMTEKGIPTSTAEQGPTI